MGLSNHKQRVLVAVTIAVAGASTSAARAHRAGAVLPIAKLTVEATVGGEAANVELGEDGGITLHAPLLKREKLVARIAGATVVAADGRVLASLRLGGYVDVDGFDKPLRLRGCSLLDAEGAEYRLMPRGDFKRACSTAVLLYWMLPLFVNGPSAERRPLSQ